jgi:hypothetical protein
MNMKNPVSNLNFKSLFDRFFDPSKPKWIYLSVAIIIAGGILSAYHQEKNEKSDAFNDINAESSTDTYIPNGYVLVPIDISNGIAVSNLMGQYTFVDVYASHGFEEQPKKIIAQNLRMLKAPHSDEQFAVLVKEIEHNLIHQLSEPVFIVIKNPNTKQIETVVQEKKKQIQLNKSRITYGN